MSRPHPCSNHNVFTIDFSKFSLDPIGGADTEGDVNGSAPDLNLQSVWSAIHERIQTCRGLKILKAVVMKSGAGALDDHVDETDLENLAIDSLAPQLETLIRLYDHKKKMANLRPHQLKVLGPENDKDHVLLTTSTGSGKSMCIWVWVLQQLLREENSPEDSTAVVCFPTQALLWGQAANLTKASDPDSLEHRRILEVGDDSKLAYAGTLVIPAIGSAPERRIEWTV